MVFLPSLLPHRYDFIEIRDGDSEAADLLGKHCGNIAPPTIISSGPSLYIKFTSDYARQGAGFSLRYEIYKTGQWLSQRLSAGPCATVSFTRRCCWPPLLCSVSTFMFFTDKGLFFLV